MCRRNLFIMLVMTFMLFACYDNYSKIKDEDARAEENIIIVLETLANYDNRARKLYSAYIDLIESPNMQTADSLLTILYPVRNSIDMELFHKSINIKDYVKINSELYALERLAYAVYTQIEGYDIPQWRMSKKSVTIPDKQINQMLDEVKYLANSPSIEIENIDIAIISEMIDSLQKTDEANWQVHKLKLLITVVNNKIEESKIIWHEYGYDVFRLIEKHYDNILQIAYNLKREYNKML